ncbi:MAG: DNA translocase FtsK [Clostridia bacterium]|nr:DNA translocase FtsK [Clostridia bacterium]
MNIDLTSIGLIVSGIISAIIIYSDDLGAIGSFIKYGILGGFFGKMIMALPLLLIIGGIYVIFRDYSRLKLKVFQVIVVAICMSGLFTLVDRFEIIPSGTNGLFSYIVAFYKAGSAKPMLGGGIIGGIIAIPLYLGFNKYVAYAVLVGITVIFSIIISGVTFSSLIIAAKELIVDLFSSTKEDYEQNAHNIQELRPNRKKKKVRKGNSEKFRQIAEQAEIIDDAEQLNFELDDDEELEETETEELEEIDEEELEEREEKKKNLRKLINRRAVADEEEDNTPENLELEHNTIEEDEQYEFPPVELLAESKKSGKDYTNKELREIAIKLQKTLESFGVDAKVTNVTRGPTVTRYELLPSVGVKVSKILRLSDDLALNLAAKSIRIEAPIPGKSAVGIEVPNRTTDTVSLREIIESDEFQDAKSKLSFSLGKSIEGTACVADIAKMPHMLIAGSTGSGKSVCINSLIMSLLYKSKPSEVKLIMIDPKVVELSVYNGIPHLLIPVVTDPKKAAGALNWAVQEMENRYQLFASKGVRDIRGYNDALQNEGEEATMPQIVIIIDELADLMMVASKEVEDAICRIAQKARAAGMHLVIATQRPSVDVITGIIKANVPSRIAFTVSSQIDSRTILDMGGAEKLLGKGDMLFYPVGEAKPIRIQGSFVSDSEIEQVIDYIKENNEVRYNENVIETLERANTPQSAADDGDDDCDEFLMEAIDLAVNMGQISASMIQRKFKVGYARAGRIVDQMEERGIISGHQGSKPRQVLISKEEWEEMQEQGETSFEADDDDEYEEEA